MKGLWCGACGDLRGLPQDREPIHCRCGQCYGRWADPHRGLALYCEMGNPGVLSAIGIHNGFLTIEDMRERHAVWKGADGYLFKQYESPVVRFSPGSSSDTRTVPWVVFERGEWLTDEQLAQEWAREMGQFGSRRRAT